MQRLDDRVCFKMTSVTKLGPHRTKQAVAPLRGQMHYRLLFTSLGMYRYTIGACAFIVLYVRVSSCASRVHVSHVRIPKHTDCNKGAMCHARLLMPSVHAHAQPGIQPGLTKASTGSAVAACHMQVVNRQPRHHMFEQSTSTANLFFWAGHSNNF
jgi:hypothetical protein